MGNTRHQLIAPMVRVGLVLGASAALLCTGVSFGQTTTAPSGASAESAQTDELSEITVTGTRIRGVAQVGSNLITIDQSAMQETGLTNTNDVLDTSPAVLDLAVGPHIAGSLLVQNGFSAFNSPDIHGLGIQATLSLTNGHRNWEEATTGDVFDPSNIPAQMLTRIEVVPDGTSPIYGSDAVAGTVNYVLRSPADVAETYFSEQSVKGSNTWYATAILGHTWTIGSQSGGIIYGYQYMSTSAQAASTYPELYNDNFSPYGGSPSSDFAAPGNILVGATTYAVPTGQNGQTLTLSQLGAAGSVNRQNIWAGAPGPDISPTDVGNDNVMNYYQNITDWLQFFGDTMYDHHTTSDFSEGTSNDIAAKVPNANPYSPCNTSHYTGGVVTGPAALVAACATGSLTVNYNDLSQVGPGWTWGIDKGWESSNGLHIKLPGDWQITPQVSLNQHLTYGASVVVSTTPNSSTFNYFCDPTTYNCGQPGAVAVTVPPYQGAATAGPRLAVGRFYQLGADGPLFTLPGGTVRLATGVEDDYWEAEEHTTTNIDPYRWDKAGYAELYIPIVGHGNAIAGIQSLEFDIAGRIDDYTDTGGPGLPSASSRTTNPKFGVSWTPIAGLKFHGSYGTSFRLPPVYDGGSLAPIWGVSTLAASAISPTVCPQCTNPALYGNDGATKLVYRESMGTPGDYANLPETARSFSAGFDWTPDSVPGLTAGINWWWIKYVGQVGNPQNNAGNAGVINSQVYNSLFIYNPAFFPQLAANNPLAYFEATPRANLNDPNCAAVVGKHLTTQTLFNEFLACSNDNAGGQAVTGATSSNPNDVLGYVYGGQLNAGSTLGDGFDLNAAYAWRNDWGNWKANFTGEYVPRFDVSVIPGAPITNEAGHFGYVLTFKSRIQLNYQREFSFGSLSPSLFINYDSPYKMDLAYLPVGVPLSYADIHAHTTLDVAIVYNTGSSPDFWLARNFTVTLSSQNVLNELPPRVLNNVIQFDPAYGWPPSRVIQLLIGKKW